LGRLGARVPLYGPANTVVPLATAEKWVETLLSRDYSEGRETTDAVFALGQLSRYSGDRARDLPDATRLRVLERLAQLGAEEDVLGPIREYRDLEAQQESQALGDSLPIGLRLRQEEPSPTAPTD
jgi:hypothetical protein